MRILWKSILFLNYAVIYSIPVMKFEMSDNNSDYDSNKQIKIPSFLLKENSVINSDADSVFYEIYYRSSRLNESLNHFSSENANRNIYENNNYTKNINKSIISLFSKTNHFFYRLHKIIGIDSTEGIESDPFITLKTYKKTAQALINIGEDNNTVSMTIDTGSFDLVIPSQKNSFSFRDLETDYKKKFMEREKGFGSSEIVCPKVISEGYTCLKASYVSEQHLTVLGSEIINLIYFKSNSIENRDNEMNVNKFENNRQNLAKHRKNYRLLSNLDTKDIYDRIINSSLFSNNENTLLKKNVIDCIRNRINEVGNNFVKKSFRITVEYIINVEKLDNEEKKEMENHFHHSTGLKKTKVGILGLGFRKNNFFDSIFIEEYYKSLESNNLVDNERKRIPRNYMFKFVYRPKRKESMRSYKEDNDQSINRILDCLSLFEENSDESEKDKDSVTKIDDHNQNSFYSDNKNENDERKLRENFQNYKDELSDRVTIFEFVKKQLEESGLFYIGTQYEKKDYFSIEMTGGDLWSSSRIYGFQVGGQKVTENDFFVSKTPTMFDSGTNLIILQEGYFWNFVFAIIKDLERFERKDYFYYLGNEKDFVFCFNKELEFNFKILFKNFYIQVPFRFFILNYVKRQGVRLGCVSVEKIVVGNLDNTIVGFPAFKYLDTVFDGDDNTISFKKGQVCNKGCDIKEYKNGFAYTDQINYLILVDWGLVSVCLFIIVIRIIKFLYIDKTSLLEESIEEEKGEERVEEIREDKIETNMNEKRDFVENSYQKL